MTQVLDIDESEGLDIIEEMGRCSSCGEDLMMENVGYDEPNGPSKLEWHCQNGCF